MPKSGSGNWLVYVRIVKASAIRVYFESEQAAIAANRELVESIEDARQRNRTIAYFNGGRVSVDAKHYVSSEVLTAGQDPDTIAIY